MHWSLLATADCICAVLFLYINETGACFVALVALGWAPGLDCMPYKMDSVHAADSNCVSCVLFDCST